MYLGIGCDVSRPIRIISTNSIRAILAYWLKCTCSCQSRVKQIVRLPSQTCMPIMPKRSLVPCAASAPPFGARPICMPNPPQDYSGCYTSIGWCTIFFVPILPPAKFLRWLWACYMLPGWFCGTFIRSAAQTPDFDTTAHHGYRNLFLKAFREAAVCM